MTGRAERPLLFLDVDGTLLSTAGVPLPSTLDEWESWWQSPANPCLGTIVPEYGARLMAMPCDLVWATAWMGDANLVIAPILGLPELRVADLGAVPGLDDPVWGGHDEAARLGWKTRGLVEQAAGRPFVWLDDEITDIDRSWVSAHHPAPALLHRVDPAVGLTDLDLNTTQAWLEQF